MPGKRHFIGFCLYYKTVLRTGKRPGMTKIDKGICKELSKSDKRMVELYRMEDTRDPCTSQKGVFPE